MNLVPPNNIFFTVLQETFLGRHKSCDHVKSREGIRVSDALWVISMLISGLMLFRKLSAI